MSDEPENGPDEPTGPAEPAGLAEPPGLDEPPGAADPAGAAGPPDAAEPVGAPRRRVPRAAIAAGLVVALVAAGSAFALTIGGGGDCPPAGVVIEVRGRNVTTEQFERRLELLRALYGIQRPGDDDPELAAAFPGDVAKSVAVGLIIEAEVDERNLRAAERAVRDSLDRYIADRYPEGGRDKFIEQLGNEGVSEDEVLIEFRRLLQTRRLFDAVTGDVEVTDAEVARAFEERREQLAVPESRKLRHLVVRTEEEAAAAISRVRAGESFAEVAKAVSLDASTKEGGGDLGPLRADQLAESFARAAFAATPGTPFGPVQTDLGWHAGLVEEIIPGRPVTLDEVRNGLSERLVAEARMTQWRSFITKEIKAARACYADGYRPADPDAPPPDIDPGLAPEN